MSTTLLTMLAAAAPSADAPPAWLQFVPIAVLGVVMWFLFLRPQMKQQKDHRQKLDALKKGDQVVTGGGLIGKVLKIDENYVDLELGPNVRVRAVKSTITDTIAPGGAAAAND